MTTQSRSRKALMLIAVAAMLLMGSSLRLAQAATAAAKLEKLAHQKFGELTPAELRVVRAAAGGNFAWGGDERNQPKGQGHAALRAAFRLPSNQPAYADDRVWLRQRRVRGKLIRWLTEDEVARKLVDPFGVHIVGARIDGVINLSFLHINFPVILGKSLIPDGINLKSAEISELGLYGSWIGKKTDTKPADDEPAALDGTGLTVHGDVYLSNEFHAYGPVQFYGAKIEGQFYCAAGQFLYPGKDSLNLRLATIGGEAELDQDFLSNGLVDLDGAKIGGDLLINGATFAAPQTGPGTSSAPPSGLSAINLNARELDWTAVNIAAETTLDLAEANVGSFTDDQNSWPKPGHLIIDGFVYGAFEEKDEKADEKEPIDVKSGLRWLNLQPSPHPPQPYEQLAKVFLDDGQKVEATTVLMQKEEDIRRQAEPQTLLGMLLILRHSLVSGFLWLTFGYGYRPLFALGWIAGFVALGTYIFHLGYQKQLIVPTELEVYKTFKDTNDPPAGYQPFNSFVYSLETFVPLIELHQKGYWLPYPANGQQPSESSGRLLRWYLWAHIVIGWIFTSLLVAGLAGLIRN